MLSSKLTTLILLITCALLGGMINYLLKNPLELTAISSKSSYEALNLTKISVSEVNSLANIHTFNQVVERPLFSNNRQPKEMETVKKILEPNVEPTPVNKPALKLIGIVLSDEDKIALFKSENELKLQRIQLGETVDGWKLIEIHSSSVKLASGKNKITFKISRKKDSRQLLNTPPQRFINKQSIPNLKIPQPSIDPVNSLNIPPQIPAGLLKPPVQ